MGSTESKQVLKGLKPGYELDPDIARAMSNVYEDKDETDYDLDDETTEALAVLHKDEQDLSSNQLEDEEMAKAVLRTPEYVAEQALDTEIDSDEVYDVSQREDGEEVYGRDSLMMMIHNELGEEVDRIATNTSEYEQVRRNELSNLGGPNIGMTWGENNTMKARRRAKEKMSEEVEKYLANRMGLRNDDQITGDEIKEIFGEVIIDRTDYDEAAHFLGTIEDDVAKRELKEETDSLISPTNPPGMGF